MSEEQSANCEAMRLIYEEEDFSGGFGIYEDPNGVFWVEVDELPMDRIELYCDGTLYPLIIGKLRQFNVGEETIKRIAKQVEAKGERR